MQGGGVMDARDMRMSNDGHLTPPPPQMFFHMSCVRPVGFTWRGFMHTTCAPTSMDMLQPQVGLPQPVRWTGWVAKAAR